MDLEGQFKINDIFNVSLSLSYFFGEVYFNYIDNYSENIDGKYIQAGIKPMFVYRPFRTGLEGIYLGIYPEIGLINRRNPYENENNYTGIEIGFGINTGYKWIFENGLTLQFGSGIGRTWLFPNKNIRDTLYDIKPHVRIVLGEVNILFDLKLGYSF